MSSVKCHHGKLYEIMIMIFLCFSFFVIFLCHFCSAEPFKKSLCLPPLVFTCVRVFVNLLASTVGRHSYQPPPTIQSSLSLINATHVCTVGRHIRFAHETIQPFVASIQNTLSLSFSLSHPLFHYVCLCICLIA
jgi:hypothetical protein